jgi:hypothetical protein
MSLTEKITLYTTAEYAVRARRSTSTIRYWATTGYGPQPFKLGRGNVYDADAVEKFIANQHAASTPDGGPDQ